MFDDNIDNSELADDKSEQSLNNEEPSSPSENALSSEEASVASDKKNDESSISADLIRGHINTIILRALYERDKYGYEIITDIERKSHGQYTLKQPTLYSALKRLENQGYIKAYWKTDEVSNGGRRKYFTLTETGKEVTETNLAEWEYSRTKIDSLISDRSFDFTQPAPTPLDFTILRDSVSRVPVIKSDEAEREDEQPAQKPTEVFNEEVVAPEPVAEIQSSPEIEERRRAEEQRRIAHENYLRLISAPVRESTTLSTNEDIVPNSQNINASKLLYNSKPEPERDYKNLIDGIFNRAVTNGSVQTSYVRRTPPAQRQDYRQGVQSTKIADKGRSDGITVASSSSEINSTYATKTTYNKGLTLFKCSAIIFAITLIEFIFCAVFKSKLEVKWAYPVVILLIGLAQFAVFGILLVNGYGRNCVRPTTTGYISASIIFSIILVLIICAVSFLLNMKITVSDIFKMIIIPSFTALNITFFSLFFKLFLR